MANILYYSVHEVLENDDLKLFESLGHTVFSLGAYCPAGPAPELFRPGLAISKKQEVLVDLFHSTGCRAVFKDHNETVVTKEFLDHFQIVVVMHDIHFIAKNWGIFKHKPTIWRTIGQAIDAYDPLAAPYRREGLRIVRWSPRELLIHDYAGHDAIIRGYKDPAIYQAWRGFLSDSFLTFSSSYRGRYLKEYDFFAAATDEQSFVVGGGSNEGMKGATGLVSFDKQLELLRESFGYLYFHGSEIPYTLNFIEAWLTGMPVIVLDRDVAVDGLNMRYNEVNDFVVDGLNGFKVSSVEEAKALLRALLLDRDRAAAVGRRGRASALALFGKQRAQQDWKHLLDTLLHHSCAPM